MESEIQIEATEKRKQPSLRDRRRTRSMAAAAKKMPRKEGDTPIEGNKMENKEERANRLGRS